MQEPAHDYRRVTYSGKRVNYRTRVMLEAAATLFGAPFSLTQGSYNPGGVAASAGTHDGGGVVDISVSSMSDSRRAFAVQCLRRVGFFAWLRTPPSFSYHIHAVACGDREMSAGAKSQQVQGFQDRNGLANWGPDKPDDPYPKWIDKYGAHVSLDRPSERPWVWEDAPWSLTESNNSSKVVQRALNVEYDDLGGEGLLVDGVFGKKSRARYRLWQKELGLVGGQADGIPGPWSLKKLGAKHGFDVRKRS